ncbi:MAG: phosphatidylserine/phosphatidylglycerophosphate/cardiolipin synthase family protein [Steroidobacterales bacterium]
MIRAIVAWLPGLTLHTLAIIVSILTYIVTTRSARERRPPSIAIAWVLGLIALPYLVLPLYLMFGRRKLRRRNATRLAGTAPPMHWAEELIDSFGLAGAADARVRWHGDGIEARRALFEVFDRAQHRLDVCTFILSDDPFGREVSDRLMARVHAGVRVRLLIDGVGALRLPRRRLHALRSAGVETAIFSPVLARKTHGPRNLRNHRKLVIADDRHVWAGGRNLAAEYFTGEAGQGPWRDLSFDLDGRVPVAASRLFEADWCASRGKPAEALIPGDPAACGARAQFLPSGPDQSEDTVHALLIAAFIRAEHRVLAVTPYLLPDAALTTAIRLAARRGVRIDICLPRASNHVLADFARGRTLRVLADAGVHFHLMPDMVHAKGFVFDSTLAVSGSPNLDSRSLLLNYESAFVFYGTNDLEWLASWITALIAEATPFVNRPPGLWRDLAEGLLLTVGYQL